MSASEVLTKHIWVPKLQEPGQTTGLGFCFHLPYGAILGMPFLEPWDPTPEEPGMLPEPRGVSFAGTACLQRHLLSGNEKGMTPRKAILYGSFKVSIPKTRKVIPY